MLTIGEAQYQDLRRHGEETYPHECCGVLVGRAARGDRVVLRVARCVNARADSPRDRYRIDPLQVVRIEKEGRERGEDILGFYHSHPDHPAWWSATDLAEAWWVGCSYVITRVSGGRAEATRSFLLARVDGEEPRCFQEEELRVVPGGEP